MRQSSAASSTAPLRVGRQEQLRRNVDLAHAPSGIDPGCKRIANSSGGDPPVADAALRHQGREADALGFSRLFRPSATMVRFSPVRGMTSATVPRQRKSQYSRSSDAVSPPMAQAS